MKTKVLLSFVILYAIGLRIDAQEKKFPQPVNTSAGHIIGGYISGDGNSIIYLSSYSQSGEPTMNYSQFESGRWSTPEVLPKEISLSKINYIWGHSLNFDGSVIYFTSRRTGIGGYDISYSMKTEEGWSVPKNLGIPINSKLNDASPSLSVSGDELFFIRCASMNDMEANGCKIMVSRKIKDDWSEPVELPEVINSGNVIAPRILADNVTLIFSSDKPGGKGGYDLYMSRREGDNWSEPRPLDFVNTSEDEIFTSIRFRGILLLYSKKDRNTYQLYERLIPEEYRQYKFKKIDFNLLSDYTGGGERLFLYDANTGEQLLERRIGLGQNTVILNEGRKYNMILQSAHGKRTFVSKEYDLAELTRSEIMEQEFSLVMPKAQEDFILEGISFSITEPFLSDTSEPALKNLTRLLKANSDFSVDIEVVMTNYQEDSVYSSNDLTEISIDSMITIFEREVPQYDVSGNVLIDSASREANESVTEDHGLNTVESVPEDSVVVTLKYTYHNDRTLMEGEALREYLLQEGIPMEQINITGRREEIEPGEKPTRYLKIRFK